MLRRTHRRRRARVLCAPESLETRVLFAAGEPDTRFSDDGIVDVAGMQVLQDVHLAAGETMLVVGGQSQAFYPYTTVARYTVAGELDPTFSSDGVVNLSNHIRPSASVLQPDGKLIVAGDGYRETTLVRFNVDGSLDNSFGVSGEAPTRLLYGPAQDVIVQPDGKILLFGLFVSQPYSNFDPDAFTLVRLNPDGSPDSTFGGGDGIVNGILSIGGYFGPGASGAFAYEPNINLFGDGDILLTTGVGGSPGSVDTQMVFAFNPDGTPDTSFNGTGAELVYVDYRRNYFRDVTIGPDQKIYAAGGYHRDYWGDVYRFTLGANGIDYDETWDSDGIRLGVHVSPGAEIEVGPDGRVVVAGGDRQHFSDVGDDFVITHLTPQGQPDPVYGASGMSLSDFGRSSFILGADIGDDGSVAMVAHTQDAAGSQLTAARFQGDGQGGPTAALPVAPFARSGYTYMDFAVEYSDADGIDFSTLDEGDIVILAPDGTQMPTGHRYASPSADGAEAYYWVYSPGRVWDMEDNGTYTVVLQPNQVADTGGAFAAGGTLGTFVVDFDFPPQPGAISGRAYNDANSNGVINTGEAGLAGRTIFLDGNGTLTRDAGEPFAVTDANGQYTLTQVAPGYQQVVAEVPAGWVATSPPFAHGVIVVPGQTSTNLNYGQRLVSPTPTPTPTPTPVSLRATADAYVRDGSYAGQNFGAAAELHLRKSATAGMTREIYLKFDLSSVASVASAKLRLNGVIHHATQTAQVAVYPVASSTWAEDTVNWNNRPAAGGTALATRTVATGTPTWYEFDVGGFLAAEKAAGRNVVTLAVRSLTATDPYLIFGSDEAASGRPELVVTPGSTSTPLPAWLAPGSAATWDAGTKALNVTGAATVIGDPGADAPLITANGSAAVVTFSPSSGRAVHIGGLTLTGGATATLASVTSEATATAVTLDSSTLKPARGGAARPSARPKPQLTSMVAAASLRTAATSRVLVVNGNTFTIDADSKLDLADNNLILNYSGASPAAGVEGMVKAGFNGGDWLGKRVTSSAANGDRNFALAVSDNSRLTIPFNGTRLFAGEAVDATSVLVKFTHRVDLDLDGVITTNDATIFNSNYSEGAAARWGVGDVDFDGLFTSNDATIFNSYYDESLGAV